MCTMLSCLRYLTIIVTKTDFHLKNVASHANQIVFLMVFNHKAVTPEQGILGHTAGGMWNIFHIGIVDNQVFY